MNVFSYWEGPSPPYIQLCIVSMQKVLGDSFTLVTPEIINDWLPQDILHPSWKALPQPALKADCIRAALLATHGGWWWDADTIALCHPKEVHAGQTDEVLYMTWTNQPRRVLNGYIYFPPGNPAAKKWLMGVNEGLRQGKVDWCTLGEKLLTTELSPGSFDTREIPRRLFLPIDIDLEVKQFFTEQEWWWYCYKDTVCFGLNHSYFVYHHRKLMNSGPHEWKNGTTLIHKLLAYAQERYG
jgi:hypothetical protein